MSATIVRASGLRHRYGSITAVDDVSFSLPAGRLIGLIGPDGVGKSTVLGLIAGARALQRGQLEVLGGNMAAATHRDIICPRIAYMPQGLGRNLYATMSVAENIDFFGRLFGQGAVERAARIDEVLASTGLLPFRDRPAGKLSGGMKQKLGLCCALIHDPDLLILDEPTTGVDPLSRRHFWELIERIRRRRPTMSVLVSTAYMEEAERFDELVAMERGRVLATGSPADLKARSGADTLEQAFIALLPESRRGGGGIDIPPLRVDGRDTVIEARNLTMRFGDFTAVDSVSLAVHRGEIFGFLGSNGCGKTTTMKMLTGLLPASEGDAFLFGAKVGASQGDARRRVGYMSQSFSLYSELTVRQNLRLHAQLFQLPVAEVPARVAASLDQFELNEVADSLPDNLPLGVRQRLSLAVATIHRPDMLILDEPTSGVDPVARDAFWRLLIRLSREDGVTIFISTHFMNEAQRCDRISLMHAGRVLATGSPAELVAASGRDNLEAAFVEVLENAAGAAPEAGAIESTLHTPAPTKRQSFSWQRLYSYAWREALELRRDPVRLLLALGGTLVLMLIMGYGISMDVEDLQFAVLDRDQSIASQNYAHSISGSRYFIERAPLSSYSDMDARLRSGELSFALEIPDGYGRDLLRGDVPAIGVWIDGAMPQRAETVRGYLQGMHLHYIQDLSRRRLGVDSSGAFAIETRFRYNPEVRSLVAMVPAVIPLLLIFIPSMLTALGVVREKELGSIINLYVTPVTRLEFLIAKQLPYVALAMINYAMLVALSIIVFQVPVKGSLLALSAAALLYVCAATGLGLLTSVFTRSQIAAIFGTSLLTLLPAIQFSGLFNPVTTLEGASAVISQLYPTTHFLIICRGIFAKAMDIATLAPAYFGLLLVIPVLTLLSAALLQKQGR